MLCSNYQLSSSFSDAFDVYNIETALPVIDMEAIESHLMAAAREQEMKVSFNIKSDHVIIAVKCYENFYSESEKYVHNARRSEEGKEIVFLFIIKVIMNSNKLLKYVTFMTQLRIVCVMLHRISSFQLNSRVEILISLLAPNRWKREIFIRSFLIVICSTSFTTNLI